MLLLIFSLNWLWIHVNLSRGRGAWSHWSDFEYTFTFPEGWIWLGITWTLSEPLIRSFDNNCNIVVRCDAGKSFKFWASREEPENQCCAMWEVTNARRAWKFSFFQHLVLMMLMVCVSKKVFIALGIISEHTKRVFNFPEWGRSRKKQWHLLIKPYSAEHRPCKQDGGPKVHTCCPRSSLQSE